MNQYSILYIKSIFKFKFYPTPEKDIFNTIFLKRVFQVIHINLQSIPYCTFIVHIGVTETFMLILPMVPPILDIIVPLNVSRKRVPGLFLVGRRKILRAFIRTHDNHPTHDLLYILRLRYELRVRRAACVRFACNRQVRKFIESIIISIDETNHYYE